MKEKTPAEHFRTTFHLLSAFQFIFSLYFNMRFIRPPDTVPIEFKQLTEAYGGIFKFFTILNVIILAIYFTVAFLNDLNGTDEPFPKQTPLMRKVKDYLFATFAFPLSLTISIAFWTIYAIDRELIFPKFVDEFFPTWLNHVYHTNITLCIVFELFLCFRKYPSRKSSIAGLLSYMAAYLVLIHVVYYKSGIWVYPFLEALSLPFRLLFFIGNAYVTVSLYRLGNWLNSIVWSNELNKMEVRKDE